MHNKDQHGQLQNAEIENDIEITSSIEDTSSLSASDHKNNSEYSTNHAEQYSHPITNVGSKDKVDSSFFGSNSHVAGEPTPEEFINPVDKQIAAIFQMSCSLSMLEASNSDMDNQSFFNSSIEVSGSFRTLKS